MIKKTRKFLAKLLGADSPKVIGVFAGTRAEVVCAARHAQAGVPGVPVWAWCAEEAEPVEGCQRFVSGREATRYAADLNAAWFALVIVAWTGRRRTGAMKMLPLLRPPFRALILNEAGDFFAAHPRAVAIHLRRRMTDAIVSRLRSAGEKVADYSGLLYSLVYRGGERTRDGARLSYSMVYRGGERARDSARLSYSAGYRAGERVSDLSRGIALWVLEACLAALAALAGIVPQPAHDTLAGLKSRRSSRQAFRPAASGSFVEVHLTGRAWPRRRIMAALANSEAEFVVLRRAGETALAGPLIEMARETDSFAVARQTAHSAWRRRAVTKHPFRRLQPGEVSEVFAPWSPLMALRRDVFLRLGCPRALTSGGALLVLFRKASAAGLRSIAMGCGGLVADEGAMPLEDFELAARVALSGRLRRLGPAQPDGLRGNVAWSPRHRRDFHGKPRVLVVSPYLPFPLAHGGAVRIYNLCRSMANEIDFVLACFREADETVEYEKLHEVFREVYVVDADERHADPTVPKQVADYRNSAMSSLIRRFCRDGRIDLVQIEYTQLAEYAADTGAVPVLLVEHDITFTLHQQLADMTQTAGARREFRRWRDFERAALQCSSAVWTVSGEDRSVAMAHRAPKHNTYVVPNGVDLDRYKPTRKTGGAAVVLFVGSFRHLPNLLAFEALCQTVMPEVWRKNPDTELHVVAGPNYESVMESAGRRATPATDDPRVRVRGFVEDLGPVYRNADVVVVPLPLSAGTNIKLMEAMACGLPVVSTSAGCRGLSLTDGHELIVAELGAEFPDAVNRLLGDPLLRERIGGEARGTAERRFGWDSIAPGALDAYSAIMRDSDRSLVSGRTDAQEGPSVSHLTSPRADRPSAHRSAV